MNYAIEVLEKERHLLEKCLSEWEIKTQYVEARKSREIMLKDIQEAILKIRNPEALEL